MALEDLKDRLSKVLGKLESKEGRLEVAQSRYLANRKRAYVAHKRQLRAEKLADKYRNKHPRKYEHYDEVARKQRHIATKNHLRAEYWLQKIKLYTRHIHKLEDIREDIQEEIKKLGVIIQGNTASGGTPRQRLKAVALASASACANGRRPNFYSQAGSWDVGHCITGERSGHRSDCSSWFTSVYKSCGLPDPNGLNYSGGFTGTLVSNGRQIRESQLKPGDAIIYGPGDGHHVEMYVGPGSKTIGHGSSPVDAGVVNLFGDGSYRCFTYLD